MTPRLIVGAHVCGSVALALALASCATPAAVDAGPASSARADEPSATRSGAHAGAGGSVVVAASTAAALRTWELARIDALLACTQGKPCSAPPSPALDDAARVLAARARDHAARQTSASAARAVIDGALAPDAFDRHARRRSLAFLDERARFALDDVGTLLLEAKRADRARILAASRSALERTVDIAAEERALLEATAARIGVTRAQLLARRAGVDEAALRALVGGALAATGPLLSAVASDVTLLADVRAPPLRDARAARTVAFAARASADPILVEAAARAALAPRAADALADWTRALAVDVRVAALSVTALLDTGTAGADADTRDALASRILSNDADVVRGAGALLTVDEGGVVIERFVALLSTPALARDLKLHDGAWIRAWQEAPPLEERGYPEAFIEVLKVLPELAAE